jgi:hypothetical protein
MFEILQPRSVAYSSWPENFVNVCDGKIRKLVYLIELKNVDRLRVRLEGLPGSAFGGQCLWKS